MNPGILAQLNNIATGQPINGAPAAAPASVEPQAPAADGQAPVAQPPAASGWGEQMPGSAPVAQPEATPEAPAPEAVDGEEAPGADQQNGEPTQADGPTTPWGRHKAALVETQAKLAAAEAQLADIPTLVAKAVEEAQAKERQQAEVKDADTSWAQEKATYRREALRIAEDQRQAALDAGHDGDAAFDEYMQRADAHLLQHEEKRHSERLAQREAEFDTRMAQREAQARADAFRVTVPDYDEALGFLSADTHPFMRVMRGEASPQDVYQLAKLLQAGHAGTPAGIKAQAQAMAEKMLAERVVGSPQAPGRAPTLPQNNGAPAGPAAPSAQGQPMNVSNFLAATKGMSPLERMTRIGLGQVAV